MRTNLVKAESLATGIPGKGAEKGIQFLGLIPEARNVFTENNDQIRTQLFGLADKLQLVQALRQGQRADSVQIRWVPGEVLCLVRAAQLPVGLETRAGSGDWMRGIHTRRRAS